MLDDFTLLLVDDHPLFRDGLVSALGHQVPGLRTQAVATLHDALQLLDASRGGVDLVLLDYLLPGMDGLHCAQVLMQRHPDVAVGLISGLDDPTLLSRARAAGLVACLPKSLQIAGLLQALQRLARGEPVFDAPPSPVAAAVENTDTPGLTARQQQVLQALASGASNKEIARQLGIAPATVKRHLEAIFLRTGAANRTQAVLMARALLDEPPS